MAVKILSIDGGGLRGILPLLILQEIENYTKKSIFDSFDFFVGSSTGGLISAGLTVPQTIPADKANITKKVPRFGVSELIGLYTTKGSEIFPTGNFLEAWCKKRIWSYLTKPMYSPDGLNIVLKEYFGDLKIGDCLKPVMIPTYCISTMEPIWFRSRITRRSDLAGISEKLAESYNITLVDALMAATAAPTYLPAYEFDFGLDVTTDKPVKRLCIDGGIYQNNPTNSALVELFRNQKEYSEKFGSELSESLDNIFILSLGTGRFDKPTKDRLKLQEGGKLKWAKPAIDISMWGNAQAVDFQVKEWMTFTSQTQSKTNYLRINFSLHDSNFEDMTNSSKGAMDYYNSIFNSQFKNNKATKSLLVDFLDNAGIY